MGAKFGLPDHEEESVEAIDKLISSQPLQHVVVEGKLLDLSSIDPNYGKPLTEDFQELLAAYTVIENVINRLKEKNLISDENVPVLFDILKLNLSVHDGSLTVNDVIEGKPCILSKDVSLFSQRFRNLENQNSQQFRFTSRLVTDFETLETIGRGGYGVVVRAVNKIDSREYAIKKIRARRRGPIMREVELLAKLDHENVNRYHSVWLDYEPIPKKSNQSADSTESGVSSVSSKGSDAVSEEIIFANEGGRVSQRVVAKGTNGSSENISNSGDDSRDKLWAFGEDVNSESSGKSDNNSKILCYSTKYRQNPINVFSPRVPPLYRTYSYPITNFQLCNQRFSPVRDQQVVLAPTQGPELQEIICIQLELCETNLQEWLIKRSKVSASITDLTEQDISTASDYVIQFYKGLEYLHSQNCIHRDIKTTNILLTNNLKVLKICDFGISKEIGKDNESMVSFQSSSTRSFHTTNIGSRPYASPEQLKSTDYTDKTDLFSSAIVFLELYHPFTTDSERVIVIDNARQRVLPKEFEEKFNFESSLILEMLNMDSEQRPSAGTVLKRLLLPRRDLTEENKQLKRRIAELESQLSDVRNLLTKEVELNVL